MASTLTRFPRLAALLAGLASATGFAPLGLWPVTLIALALLLHLISGATTTRRALLLGWLFGVGHFALGNNWIATAFTYQAAMPAWLGWIAVILLSLYLAVYPALAAASAWWLVKLVERRSAAHNATLTLTLLFAATWIITEWLRSWVFTGFAWNPLSAIWLSDNHAHFSELILPLLGSYGWSGIVILIAGGLRAQFLEFPWNRRNPLPEPPVRQQLAAQVGVAVLITGVGLLVYLDVGRPADSTPNLDGPPITIVQPNIDQGDKWDMEQRRANFTKLAGLSPPQSADAAPRLLLWPEAAVPDYLESGYPLDWYIEPASFVRARLAALLGPDDLLLTGAVRLESNAARTDVAGARNSVFTLNARQQLGPRYDKAHLVPYGEYLPMRSILEPLGLSRLAPGAVDFWPGPGPRTLDLGRFGKVGVQICYEIIFSGQVVDRANRPAFLFNPSNDAWFGSWGPPQHLAQARMRAIEEGLPVIRSTPTGISAIIDADGRIIDSIPMHRAGRIDGFVPAAHRPTPFARWGNALPLAFAALLLAFGLMPLARRPAKR
ncbi:apolipoprotein N-acyltransferase [Sphingomonas lacunae]|uniref:Apolipoprotein N-acyltransferase n=1 Tax=Sphingomonas lacunae TaxID=2698828 RepID=A0A6M4AVP0_9SPHN|nr:apolipoprotein N-acyltransferase [Sphingomonas lacunae]QJQ32372.1 apolipoprotein N-acyltransferase [Sphingomonas lacunae]